jgi:hypothetical protein
LAFVPETTFRYPASDWPDGAKFPEFISLVRLIPLLFVLTRSDLFRDSSRFRGIFGSRSRRRSQRQRFILSC